MKIKKIICPAVSVIGVCTLLTACGTVRLDPADYVEINVNGADGYGKVSLDVDYSDLEDDVIDALGDDSSKKERAAAMELADSVKFEITSDKLENLTNGDVIEISVDYDADDAKEDGNFMFKSDKFEYKVEDLKEAEEYDPFEGVDIKFTGFSPKGRYDIDTSGVKSDDISYYISYEVENAPETVANGDTITLRAECSNEELLLQEGYVLSPETKEFTVSGLEEGKTIDPFEGLVLDYKGIAPEVSVSFDTTGCDEFVRNNVDFRASQSGLSNGENVTVTASYSESKAEENGIVFTQEEKNYTIEGAPYYPSDDTDIDFTDLDNDFKDLIESKIAGENYYVGSLIHGRSLFKNVKSSDEYKITKIDITPVKKMYFVPKDNSTWIKDNHLVVWEIKVTAEKTGKSDGSTHDTVEVGKLASGTLLAETYIQNFAVNADGTLNYSEAENKNCTVYYTTINGAYWDDSLLTMTADTITEKWRSKNVGNYNITISDYE